MLKINELKSLYLGVQGENLALTRQVDMSEWLVEHPNGAVSVWHKINGAVEPEPTGATLDAKTGILSWSPTAADTAHAGEGKAEIRLTDNGVIKKTKEIQTIVAPSVTLNGCEIGSGWQQYINIIEAIKNQAIAAKNRSEEIIADVAEAISKDVLDDTAGAGVTKKGWSANKLVEEFAKKADEDDVEAELTKRTKFSDIFAGCEEYTPSSAATAFIYGIWYHQAGKKYICTPKNTWGYTAPGGTLYNLPEASTDDWYVYTLITILKEDHEAIGSAQAAAQQAAEAARSAAAAAIMLYLDEDGDLCQAEPEEREE